MDHFSEEYRNKLIAEHKLVSAAILQFTENYKRYMQHHSPDSMTAAHTSLKSQKLELELKIDALTDYLKG